MYIYQENGLRDFKPWAGAKAVFNRLTTDELDQIEETFFDSSQFYSETEINDFFWFDTETILEILDISEEEFYKREL